MKILALLETLSPIIAYHGSNDGDITQFSITNDSVDKDSVLFFTNSIDYAAGHGSYLYKVSLQPRKVLKHLSLSDGEIIEILEKYHKRRLDSDNRDRIIPIVKKQIESFNYNGNLSGLFAGLGGFRIIRWMGYDMAVIKKNSDILFYVIFDDSIVNILDVNKIF